MAKISVMDKNKEWLSLFRGIPGLKITTTKNEIRSDK